MLLFNILGISQKKDIQLLAERLHSSYEEVKYYDSDGKIFPERQLQLIEKFYGIQPAALRLMLGDIPTELIGTQKNIKKLQDIQWEIPSKEKEEDSKLLTPVFSTNLGKLFEGDCMDLLRELDTGSIDLVFADPPFNLGKKYPSKINDNLKEAEYVSWCKKWIDECIRVLKFGGALLLWNIPKWHLALSDYLLKRLTFRDWIGVDMKYSLPIPGRLYPSHYSLLYFIKGKKPNTFHPDRMPMQTCKYCFHELKDYGGYKDKMNPDGINLSEIWLDIPPVRHSKYKKRQTANELSIKLLDRIIQMTTNEGNSVLDPFGGAGTTYVVAELKNRHWIGIDIGDTQCIVSRFAQIEEERKYLAELRSQINCLFPPDVEQKRIQNRIWVPSTLKTKTFVLVTRES